MKLGSMIMFLVIVQLSFMLFDNTLTDTSYNLSPNNVSSGNSTVNSVYDFIINPTVWANSNFMSYLSGYLLTTGGIVVGLFLVFRPDITITFGLFVFFLGFGAIPIINIYNLIVREVGAFACTPGVPCSIAIILAALTAGLLALYYVICCIEFWTNRQLS